MAIWDGLFRRRQSASATLVYKREHISDMAAALRGWSYACIDRRASEIAKVDFDIYLRDQFGRETPCDERHWARRLFDNPNPIVERWWIRYLPSAWRDLKGNAFIYTPTVEVDGPDGKREIPHSMWVLPADRVEVIVDPTFSKLIGYVYHTDAGRMPIDRKRIIHLKHLRPSTQGIRNFFLGTSLVEACIDEIQTRYEINGYLRKFFENDALPPLVLTTPETMSEETFNTLKSRWNEKFPQHRIIGLLENQTDIKPVTSTGGLGAVDKQDTRAITEESVEIICAVFGMNKGLLTGDFSERSTAEVQRDLFMSSTVDGILAYMDEAFTKWLQHYDPRLVFRHKRDAYVDPEEKRQQELHDFNLGLVTRNDLRKDRGLPEVDDGDTFYLNGFPIDVATTNDVVTTAPASMDTAATATPIATDGGEGLKSLGESVPAVERASDEEGEAPESFRDPSMAAIWKRLDAAAAPYSAGIERGVRLVFEELGEEVATAVESGKRGRSTVTKADLVSDKPLFDVAKFKRKLRGKTSREVGDLIQEMMKDAVEKVGANWDSIESSFDREARLSLNQSLAKITVPVDGIEVELKQLIRDNYDKTPAEIADKIRTKFEKVYTQSRAALIARTTSTFAVNDAQRRTWQKLGFKRQWLSQRDGDVRISHRNADGQIEDATGNFVVNGYQTPQPCGDGLPIKEVANCRCYTMAVLA